MDKVTELKSKLAIIDNHLKKEEPGSVRHDSYRAMKSKVLREYNDLRVMTGR